jgi:hypothetical protein
MTLKYVIVKKSVYRTCKGLSRLVLIRIFEGPEHESSNEGIFNTKLSLNFSGLKHVSVMLE